MHSSLLLPPRGRNATAWDNPYLDQEGAVPAPTRSSSSSTTRERTSTAAATQNQPFHVYVDLDGVLCDFEHGVRSIFPEMTEAMSLQDLERHDMWRRISSQSSFFNNLPWAEGGKELWDAVRHLRPDILTGVPAAFEESRAEKFEWCARELFGDSGYYDDARHQRQRKESMRLHMVEHVDMAGQHFRHARVNDNPRFHLPSSFRQRNRRRLRQCDGAAAGTVPRTQRVITCWSTNKHHESRPGAVLIDDCLRLRDDWERKGGIFIHHETGNAQKTLQQLIERGVLNEYTAHP
jgi:phosphoglycolate phosphatase-like HAD superfamily hydrolase